MAKQNLRLNGKIRPEKTCPGAKTKEPSKGSNQVFNRVKHVHVVPQVFTFAFLCFINSLYNLVCSSTSDSKKIMLYVDNNMISTWLLILINPLLILIIFLLQVFINNTNEIFNWEEDVQLPMLYLDILFPSLIINDDSSSTTTFHFFPTWSLLCPWRRHGEGIGRPRDQNPDDLSWFLSSEIFD